MTRAGVTGSASEAAADSRCPLGDLETRQCVGSDGQATVAAWCPQLDECAAERRALSKKYNPRLTDDEVRDLGYTHRDDDGWWQRPHPVRRPYGGAPTSMTVTDDTAMMAALVDAYDGNVSAAAADWCVIKREADKRVAEEIAATTSWQPKVAVPPITSAEREKFDRLLADGFGNKPTIGAVKRQSDTGRTREWAVAAVEQEAERVAAAVPGTREETLRAAAWTLSRPDLLEHLTADEVASVLIPAGVTAGLTEREARSTVQRTQRARGAR